MTSAEFYLLDMPLMSELISFTRRLHQAGTYVDDKAVSIANEPIEKHADALVAPDSQELVHVVEPIRSRHRQSVVDARQVTQVEDVVKLGRRRRQIANHSPDTDRDLSCGQLKPRPHQQQCRSSIVECYKLNDSFDKVECCFDIVAVFGNNVERNFVLSTKSKQIEHVQFVSILSKGRNFIIESFDIVAGCGNKVEWCFDKVERCFDNVACCFDIVAGVWTGL